MYVGRQFEIEYHIEQGTTGKRIIKQVKKLTEIITLVC